MIIIVVVVVIQALTIFFIMRNKNKKSKKKKATLKAKRKMGKKKETRTVVTPIESVSTYSKYSPSKNVVKTSFKPNDLLHPATGKGWKRYSLESEEQDIFIPEETNTYAPNKIENFIRLSILHRERENYEEALKFLEMAEEMPEYFMYPFYRYEILALQGEIERSRSQRVIFTGVNERDENFPAFEREAYREFSYPPQKFQPPEPPGGFGYPPTVVH